MDNEVAKETEIEASEATASIPSEQKKRKALSSHVRFSQEQFDRIQAHARATKVSIPDLLKYTYFKNGQLRILMDRDQAEAWFAELRRWGNNLNQLAKRVNSGIMEGWYSEFSEINKRIAAMQTMLMEVYGRSRI